MLSYCLKSRKNVESKNPKVVRAKNGRIMSKFCQNCSVIVKNWNILNSKKIVNY